MKFGMGQPVRRTEDIRFITGRGRYTDDITLDRQAYAVFVRSPHAHAVIRGIDVSVAKRSPGIVGVLTPTDVAAMGAGTMPLLVPFKNRDGSMLQATSKTLLAGDKARFPGEAIVMVVAESAAQAKDVAELVRIDYEPLKAAGALDDAPRGAQIWDQAPGNLAFEWENGDSQAVDAAFAKAARKIAVEVVQNRVVPNAMETRAAIGVYDKTSHSYTLYAPTQGAAGIRDRVAGALLKIPPEKLRVITPDVGGGFGMKGGAYPEQALVLLAAKAFGRPVKWTGERMEAFLCDTHGRDARTKGEMALDADGHILAVRVAGKANLGGYLSAVAPIIATVAGLNILGGVYRVPAAYAGIRGYYTNCAPVDAYRGAGRPEAAYLMERMMDAAARACGLDRLEIRRRNLLTKKELPYRNWAGAVIDSGDFIANLDNAARRADWEGFGTRRKEAAAHGRLRGIGIGYYLEIAGGPPIPEPSVIRFVDNGVIEVHLATQSNGQGHETSFAQVAAERLGVPFESIVIKQGDTADGLSGMGSFGSRSLVVSGNAIVLAADEVIAKGKAAAGHVLQAGGKEVGFTITDGIGRFHVVGTDRTITIGELGITLWREKLPGFEGGLHAPGIYKGGSTFPNGCHICEVEIDRETGKTDVVRYVIVDDFGRLINPLLVAGQVHGGIAQGLGQALLEHCVYDGESGQLLTASFTDYALPRADDIPPLDLTFNEVPTSTHPLGSKGTGEAGTVGALPAIMSAVADALGVVHIDMPATPEKIWRTILKTRAA